MFVSWLALAARGYRNGIPLWGVNLSQAVLGALIACNPKDIVISTNNDVKSHAAGQRAAVKIKGVLDRFFDDGVVRIVLPGPKDLLDQHQDDEAWAEWESRLNPAESAPSSTSDIDM